MKYERKRVLPWWGVILPVMGLVIAIGVWCFARVEESVRMEVASSLTTVRDGAVAGMTIWLDDKEKVASTWANESGVRRLIVDQLALAGSGATPAELRTAGPLTELRNQLRPVCAAYNFIGFVLVDTAGVNVGALLDEPIGLSSLYEGSDFIPRVLGGETLVTPPFPASVALPDAEGTFHHGQPTMFTAAPIVNAGGDVIAALAFRIRPYDEFTSILTSARLGGSGETYAFDAGGLMLTLSRFEEQLLDLGLVRDRPGEKTILQLRLADPGRDMREGSQGSTPRRLEPGGPLTLAVRSAVQGLTAIDVLGYRDYRGAPVVGAWTWLPQRGFGVVTELDREEAYARLGGIRPAVLAVVALLLLSVVIGARLTVLNRRQHAALEREASLTDLLRTTTAEIATASSVEEALRLSAARIASWGSWSVGAIHLEGARTSREGASEPQPGTATISLPISSGGTQLARMEFLSRSEHEALEPARGVDLETLSEPMSRSFEHLQARLLLKETLGRLEMQEHALDQSAIVTSTDVRGNITYVNDAFCEISGYSREELLGQNHRILKSDEHPPEFFKEMWRTIAHGDIFRGEIKNKKKDGSFYWVSATIVPFTRADGRPYQYIAIRVDITERKRTELEMLALTEELRGANRTVEAARQELQEDLATRRRLEADLVQAQKLEAVGQLAAGIAHEINTPTQFVGDNTRFLEESFRDLAPLLKKADELAEAVRKGGGSAELADDLKAAFEAADVEYLDEEIPRAIGQSLEGLERVRKIVLAMKEFSHPGAEGITSLDLNHAIESTITVATNEWKYVAEMEKDLDPELPPVACLPGEFNQVILNMIVNATHAIADALGERAEGKGTITISTRRDGEFVEIRIADTGTGIPEEARDRVFDPFFTTKEVGKGTGQGLSIAHRVVVEKHGGTLDFETELGKGTTFVIRLPLERQEAA